MTHRHSGLTLLEVLFAMAVLLFGFISVVALFPVGIQANATAANDFAATNLGATVHDLLDLAIATAPPPYDQPLFRYEDQVDRLTLPKGTDPLPRVFPREDDDSDDSTGAGDPTTYVTSAEKVYPARAPDLQGQGSGDVDLRQANAPFSFEIEFRAPEGVVQDAEGRYPLFEVGVRIYRGRDPNKANFEPGAANDPATTNIPYATFYAVHRIQ